MASLLTRLRRLAFTLERLLRRRATERDLDAELRFHLETEAEAQEAAGLSPADARLAARRDFGRVAAVAETTRAVWTWTSVERLVQDLRYGLRTLRRSPGFALAAVLSIALGIGANTAIFSLLDLVLLRSLPVHSPEQLVIVAHAGASGEPSTGANYPIYETLRTRARSFSGVVAFWPLDFKLRRGDRGDREAVRGLYVTGNYFQALGVAPIVGRTFDEADFDEPRAMISYGLWQRAFGGRPDVLGRPVTVNGVPLTIVGVTPPEFFGLQRGDLLELFLPLGVQRLLSPESGNRLTMRNGVFGLTIVGRLHPHVPVATARAETAALIRPWIEEVVLPATGGRLESWARIELLPGDGGLHGLRRRFSTPLRVLMAIAGAVLLISCANVASLLLARAASRRKEIAVRLAIGAGRARIVRQLVTESLLLAGLGGLLGIVLAIWCARLLVAFISEIPQPPGLLVQPDARVLAFTAIVSLLTGLAFGLVPALRATRVDLTPALKERSDRGRWADRVGLLRRLLVASQVALSVLVVIGAGLFVRTLSNIRQIDPRFDPEHLLLVSFDPMGTGYQGEKLHAFYDRVVERVGALPGVRSVSLSTLGPLSADDSTRFFNLPAFTSAEAADRIVHMNAVSPGFFATMGVPIVAGRTFRASDDGRAPRVAIVNESTARFYFPDGRAVGQTFRLGRDATGPAIEIVGVSRDMKQSWDLRQGPDRTVYLPIAQQPSSYLTLEVRAATDAAAIASALPAAVREISADVPIRQIRTVRAQIDANFVRERLIAMLSSLFGLLALAIAAIGLYGLVNYAVSARTSEFGIRMALGAAPRDVVGAIVREAGALVGLGAIAGVLAAVALTRLVESLLYDVTPRDPLTFGVGLATLAVVAAAAALLPARRAVRIDPAVALRDE